MPENGQEAEACCDAIARKSDYVVFPDGFALYVRRCLSIPFIYAIIVPAIFMDLVVSLYNRVAFPLYGMSPVRRSDYVVFERRYLRYLGPVQRLNCWYCSYLNGLLPYCTEVGARTERYWCPIKAARRPIAPHRFYDEFAAYGDRSEWERKNHGRGTVRTGEEFYGNDGSAEMEDSENMRRSRI